VAGPGSRAGDAASTTAVLNALIEEPANARNTYDDLTKQYADSVARIGSDETVTRRWFLVPCADAGDL
jgi:hypothetical protein